MIINFDNIGVSVIKNFRGGSKDTAARMFNDNENRIMYGVLEPGASIGMHTHEHNSEIVYILQGKGKALYDNGEETVEAGLCHYCPKGHAHSLINDGGGDLVFFAVVPEQS